MRFGTCVKRTRYSNLILGCGWLMIQLHGSPGTPVNSNSSSGSSAPLPLTEELDSGANHAHYGSKKELLGDVSSTFY